MSILKDITTIANGRDYCESKVLGLGAFIVLVLFSGYQLYKMPDHFSIHEFAFGIATIILSAAGGGKIKESTEPKE